MSVPPSSEPNAVRTQPDPVDAIVEALARALARDAGGGRLILREGFRCIGVAARTFRRRVPVVSFARENATLSFIVTQTNPAEPAYRRTPHFDVTYFSEDVPDHEQDRIYARDRQTIDAFAHWLANAEGEDGTFP
jgi:hypothetical protein